MTESVLDTQTQVTVISPAENSLDLFYEGEGYLGAVTRESNPEVYEYYRQEYTEQDTENLPTLEVIEFVDGRRIALQFDEEANGTSAVDPFEDQEIQEPVATAEEVENTADTCVSTENGICQDETFVFEEVAQDAATFGVLEIALYIACAIGVATLVFSGLGSLRLGFFAKLKKRKLILVAAFGLGLLVFGFGGIIFLSRN